jgi:hypothetical protein
MSGDLAQFTALAALIIRGFGLFAFMFQRLETRLDGRIDRQDGRFGAPAFPVAGDRRLRRDRVGILFAVGACLISRYRHQHA